MKRQLRKEMKAKLAAMSREEIRTKSSAACAALIALPEYQAARAIMLYLALPEEADTADIAMNAWQQDKVVLAPKVDWSKRHMLAAEIHSLDEGIVCGRYGIGQPAERSVWPAEQIDLIVVPALAYDRAGRRLGRGGGFYDRFLARPDMRAVACGLAFDAQLVEQLPAGKHDQPVDILVTNKEVLRFKSSELLAETEESET